MPCRHHGRLSLDPSTNFYPERQPLKAIEARCRQVGGCHAGLESDRSTGCSSSRPGNWGAGVRQGRERGEACVSDSLDCARAHGLDVCFSLTLHRAKVQRCKVGCLVGLYDVIHVHAITSKMHVQWRPIILRHPFGPRISSWSSLHCSSSMDDPKVHTCKCAKKETPSPLYNTCTPSKDVRSHPLRPSAEAQWQL